ERRRRFAPEPVASSQSKGLYVAPSGTINQVERRNETMPARLGFRRVGLVDVPSIVTAHRQNSLGRSLAELDPAVTGVTAGCRLRRFVELRVQQRTLLRVSRAEHAMGRRSSGHARIRLLVR